MVITAGFIISLHAFVCSLCMILQCFIQARDQVWHIRSTCSRKWPPWWNVR